MTVTEERPPTPEEEHEAIELLWEEAPGTPGFFASVDHKRIGMRYIYTAFIFFFIAGIQALLLRAQLTSPDSQVMGPQTYNQMFTMHGTTMIFLFNTPVLAGFGNYLLPLQLGTRDMAFPRLNAFSYWIFILAAIFMYSSYLVGRPPAGGWFAYVPLANKTYSPGINMDFWGLGVTFVGISTTVGAVNFIVTIFKMRAPGMTLNRMPMFVWSILAMAVMVIFAVPALTVGTVLLEADRLFGTQFYEAAGGGNPLLYQHLFWFWGHPEVYILFVPAAGMVATIIPVFARRRLAGYKWVAASLVAISFISFGVWVHHMFATGLPALAMSFFSAASLIIAIPSGVLFFCLIATIWRGQVEWTVPFLFALGWFLIFLLGGVTGVMLGVMPFDWQATDSYFIVAHFHYVLNGAVVFPIFGALYYWLPKMTGRMLDEKLGKVSFWIMFVGFNLAFFPMHVLGLLGAPADLHLQRGPWLGHPQPGDHLRQLLVRARDAAHLDQLPRQQVAGPAGRGQSVERRRPGVVDAHLASSRVQLRVHPRGGRPPPALGQREARGGRVGHRRCHQVHGTVGRPEPPDSDPVGPAVRSRGDDGDPRTHLPAFRAGPRDRCDLPRPAHQGRTGGRPRLGGGGHRDNHLVVADGG